MNREDFKGLNEWAEYKFERGSMREEIQRLQYELERAERKIKNAERTKFVLWILVNLLICYANWSL